MFPRTAKYRVNFIAIAAFSLFGATALAQTGQGLPPASELYKTVENLDARLFDAYNHCDLAKLGSMVAEDLEFYHDKTGLSVGRQSLIDGVKNNICGKVRRELVPGSLEVYPLEGYGAVEMGVHRFTHPGDPSNLGDAKFVHVWRLKDGVWQVTRVLSFDHHAAG